MPVIGPTGSTVTICDLAPEVIFKVENRTTDVARAQQWLIDALIEIANNPDFRNEFCELEQWGIQFNLTPGVQEYNFNNIIPGEDIAVNQATLDILMWLDPPVNSVRRQLQPVHYQEADSITLTQSAGQSVPTKWYRFANMFGVVPVPNAAYQVQPRFLLMHPIGPDPCSTVILLPQDWNEVLVWAAAERGFMELLEYEKAGQIHQLLYGDPKHPDRPGLIEGKKKKREREAWRKSNVLKPYTRGYSYGTKI
jgi:hypothetical protein